MNGIEDLNPTHLAYALNTLYILLSGALVFWMAAGFSMLEAGLVRSKNVSEILTKNIGLYSVACLGYLIIGYNIMYVDGNSAWLPNFTQWFIGGSDHTIVNGTIGHDFSRMANFFFQMVFVATAMSVVSGAVAERMKLWSFLIFAIVMTTIIYPIQGYWQWGGGILSQMGFVDFAGSGVVHLAGASAALAGVLLLGPRLGKYVGNKIKAIPGSNLTLATLGTMILWLGWLGFNGGSNLTIDSVDAANAVSLIFVNTNLAAVSGFLSVLLFSRFAFRKSDLTLALNGALAGLVAITASPDTPTPELAIAIGFGGGLICVIAILVLDRLRIDDPVGAISVHGVAGIFGLLVVPFSHESASFVNQILGILLIFSWVFTTSFFTWWVIKKIIGIRVSASEELEGSDVHECGLEAYPEFNK